VREGGGEKGSRIKGVKMGIEMARWCGTYERKVDLPTPLSPRSRMGTSGGSS